MSGRTLILTFLLVQTTFEVVNSFEEFLFNDESDPDEVLGMPRFFIQSGAGLLSLDTGNLTINFLPFIVYTILAFLLGK